MHKLLAVLGLMFLSAAALAATPHNDDSCDVAILPAATLLLPYFEVDLESPTGETTLFSITNVTNLDRVVQVTLWTDRAYPVASFHVYLTGYDVQAINLYDVLARGVIGSPAGTGTLVTPKRGMYSDANAALDLTACTRLPGAIDAQTQERLRDAFTEGHVGGCDAVGGRHAHAVGYATVDVVGACTKFTPGDEKYWTEALRYDNVLIGDYHQVNSSQNYAQGGPLVHIRAIPEGGTPASRRDAAQYVSGFRQTFYGRYQDPATPRLDGRQPLPAQFATRWIQGSASDFRTSLKVWREGRRIGENGCGDYAANGDLDATEVVVFDENENAVGTAAGTLDFPVVSLIDVGDADAIPQIANGAVGGWMYLNLDRDSRDDEATQNWVISSMRALGRFSTDTDAVALGNGCTADVRPSEVTRSTGAPIAPARNHNGVAFGVAEFDNDASCDISLQPAATLLLPYFRVDLDDPQRENTLFTVTNVSPSEQIARVTLWTDYGYPVTSFNIFLTGYDVQSINLYDVLASGVVAPGGTGTRVSPRGAHSEENARLDRSRCGHLPQHLGPELVQMFDAAFRTGIMPGSAGVAGCDEIGDVHDDAVGYATIDLVRNCAPNGPMTREYWSNDLAYDNVLTGDAQQLHGRDHFAESSTMVHVRAIPEGGTAAERLAKPETYATSFPRTFYSRYQPEQTPKLDGRQPLPSTFAPRWIQGGREAFQTFFNVWREGRTSLGVSCGMHDDNVTIVTEIVRFDEAENAVGDVPVSRITPITFDLTLPTTSRTSTADASVYPVLPNGAVAGWMYLNLDCSCGRWGSQNWVTYSMKAEGRYSTSIDAAALGNGCSRATPESEITTGTQTIGPAPNRR